MICEGEEQQGVGTYESQKNKDETGSLPATDPPGNVGGLHVLCVMLESWMSRWRALVMWCRPAKGGPPVCRQQDTLRCDKYGGKELRPGVKMRMRR